MDMKTFLQLVLTHRGTNPNQLREKTGSPAIQSAASRILTGKVKSTKRKTVEALAQELDVDVEAFLSNSVATSELERLGIPIPGEVRSSAVHALAEAGELIRGSNFSPPRRPVPTIEESLWRIAVQAAQIEDAKERAEIAELVRLVVDNPAKNADDQIPIIVRRLSGGASKKAATG